MDVDLNRAIQRADQRAACGEERLLAYARLDDRLFVMAYTWRDEVCRVISLRKANRREVRRCG